MDGRLYDLVGSVLDHTSLPPDFKTHIWRVFHFWLHFITFGGHTAHLAYHVHKSDHKTSVTCQMDSPGD